MFTIVSWGNISLFCFNQPPLSFSFILLPRQSINGERLLSDVEGGLMLSSNNPLDFHSKIYICISNHYKISGWNTKRFCVPSSSKWLLPLQ